MAETTPAPSVDFMHSLQDEVKNADYQWLALEGLSDLLCVALALYFGFQGFKMIWPYHEGYLGTKKGFLWLASRWGVGAYPNLFRTIVGLAQIFVFIGCLACFIPTMELLTCTALTVGAAMCVAFFVTHSGDPWKVRSQSLQNLVQTLLSLGIRLYQDFPWNEGRTVLVFKVVSGLTCGGLCYMLYRRNKYGRVPDPLLP